MRDKRFGLLLTGLIVLGGLTFTFSSVSAQRTKCRRVCSQVKRCVMQRRCYWRPFCYRFRSCSYRTVCRYNRFGEEFCKRKRVCSWRRRCARRKRCGKYRTCYPVQRCRRVCHRVAKGPFRIPTEPGAYRPKNLGGNCGMNLKEQLLFALANQRRAAKGLKPFRCSSRLVSAARRWSRWQCYHKKPSHKDLALRIRYTGIQPLKFDESIAAGLTLSWSAFDAWMRTPKHVRKILNPNFTHIGIGWAPCPPPFLAFWTQIYVQKMNSAQRKRYKALRGVRKRALKRNNLATKKKKTLQGILVYAGNAKNPLVYKYRTRWFLKIKGRKLPLHGSKSVVFSRFQNHEVEVVAVYKSGKPYLPKSSGQFVMGMGSMPEPSFVGRGHHVLEIRSLLD